MKTLVICGATATGKTALAVQCAKMLGGEVISADSEIVYKGLNIGTAKPTAAEMDGVPHHMIDVADPKDNYSVIEYQHEAEPIIQRLEDEGKTPIICGGTGFYINSLLFDCSYGRVAGDPEIREKYERIARTDGKETLYHLLQEVDPKTAAKLHPNDVRRVVRALEIFESSGKKKSDLHDGYSVIRDYVAVAVEYPRDELYKRIDRRVDDMFDRGLIEEVRSLMRQGVNEDSQCMQAIGYKEVISGLHNRAVQSTMRDIVKLNTRHYAKRQIVFFKKIPGIIWLKPEEATAEHIVELYNSPAGVTVGPIIPT